LTEISPEGDFAMTPPEFICDGMLGRLAKNLRMLGFNTAYARDACLKEIMKAAADQRRILITRRTAALKLGPVPAPFLFIRENDPSRQLLEVLSACALKPDDFRPLTLCLRCNALLEPIDRQTADGQVPEYVLATASALSCCPKCRRVYWRGTHYEAMQRKLSKLA
jgi:uncharacterized protein with PIN domain